MPSELIKHHGIIFEHVYKDAPPAEESTGFAPGPETTNLKIGDVSVLELLDSYVCLSKKGLPCKATDDILQNGTRL